MKNEMIESRLKELMQLKVPIFNIYNINTKDNCVIYSPKEGYSYLCRSDIFGFSGILLSLINCNFNGFQVSEVVYDKDGDLISITINYLQ